MIVDFQHHFTPRELFKEDLGDRRILQYDESGAPSYTSHRLLYDLDEHVAMMDAAGIDAAVLTSGAGMCAPIDKSRLINDKARQAERDYPGRFIGCAQGRDCAACRVYLFRPDRRHRLCQSPAAPEDGITRGTAGARPPGPCPRTGPEFGHPFFHAAGFDRN